MSTVWIGLNERLVALRPGERGWEATSHLEGHSVSAIAADPNDPARLYCGTSGDGLWRSVDGGTTWQRANNGIDRPDVTALATGRAKANANGTVVYAGTEPSAIYRSDDGGESWIACGDLTQLPSSDTWHFPPRPWTHHVRAIATSPVEPDRLYVCIEAGALIRSVDGGRTWEDRRPGGPFDTHTLRIPRAAPHRLLSAAGDGWFESDDAGETWRRPRDGMRWSYLWGLAAEPEHARTILVSASPSPARAHSAELAESTVFRREGDDAWLESPPAPTRGSKAWSLAVDPTEHGIFYAANNRGLYQSTDDGRTWICIARPWAESPAQTVRTITVTPA